MKRIAFAIALSALAGAAFAADPTPKASPAAKADLVCPVTKEKIASVKEAAGSSVYKGKTYYFCCAGCKPMFDKNPAKYVQTASVKTKAPAKGAPKPAASPAAKS